ncbi:hypothetical protein ACLI4Y_07140 [Natrialbaceae archaeon A-CW3]
MKRRRFVIGTGVLAASTSIVLGSGAFTSTKANRSISISVADEDPNAFLAIDAESEIAEIDDEDGTIEITVDDELGTNGGTGVGTNSTYTFWNVFSVQNLGTKPIDVYGKPGSLSNHEEGDSEKPEIVEPEDSEITVTLLDDNGHELNLEGIHPGDPKEVVSVKLDTSGVESDGSSHLAEYVLIAESVEE